MIYFTGYLAKARDETELDPATGRMKPTARALELRKLAKEMRRRMLAGEVTLSQRRLAEDRYEYHAIPTEAIKPRPPVALPHVTMAQLRSGR